MCIHVLGEEQGLCFVGLECEKVGHAPALKCSMGISMPEAGDCGKGEAKA